jgi:hypothetical protein
MGTLRTFLGWAAAILGGALLAGCASAPEPQWEDGRVDLETKAPLPLDVSVAWLFTNQPPFRAKVAMTRAGDSADRPVQALLAGSGGRLYYSTDHRDRDDRPRNLGFVWDAGTASGFVMSDALQGYAPLAAAPKLTAVEPPVTEGALFEKVDGHEARIRSYVGVLEDGSRVEMRVWEATDLRGFPVRIQQRSRGGLSTATISDVRFEAVASGLFQPPEGFTRFESSDRMINELLRRLTPRRREGRRDYDDLTTPEWRRPGPGMY